MSGGSFNYLCSVDDAGTLMERVSDLQAMADALSRYPNGEVAEAETRNILAYIATADRLIRARLPRLSPVWRAVEWEHSCDTTTQDTLKALDTYNKGAE